MARDAKALAVARHHQVEDCDPIPEEEKDAVRRLICAHAVGSDLGEVAADAEQLMKMLGVHFSQDDEEGYRVGVAPLPVSASREVTTTPPLMRPYWQ